MKKLNGTTIEERAQVPGFPVIQTRLFKARCDEALRRRGLPVNEGTWGPRRKINRRGRPRGPLMLTDGELEESQ